MPSKSSGPSAIELRSFDLLPLGLCVLDREMIVRSWNRALEEWTGTRRGQMIGRPFGEGFPNLASLPLRERIESVLGGDGREETLGPLEGVLAPPQAGDGKIRNLTMHRTTVRRWDDSGELVLVVMEDVTTEFQQIHDLLAERKSLRGAMWKLEEQARALRDSEEWFNLALRGSSDGIWDWNLLTNEVYYSPRFKELVGYSDEEFENVFASLQSHLHPDDAARALSTIDAHVHSKKPLDIEARLGTKDGGWRWFRIRAQAIADARGLAVRMAGAFTDITERKRAEVELQRYALEVGQSRSRIEAQASAMMEQAAELQIARRRAEQASQTKSEFLANMSHEIRTPISAILGYADLLLTEEGVEHYPPARTSAIETIKRNGEHLLELINDILDVSKIEASCVTIERIRFSPAKIVADVVALMKVRAEAKKLDLDIFFDGAVPETIESDPTRLRQILINLVGNALKFTEAGGVRIGVCLVPGESGGGLLELAVSDSGIGMDEQQLARLFRPFSQADPSTTRKFGGTGLGLTISKRFAKMLGGDIAVTSDSGKGSTFYATIATGSLAGVRMVNPSSMAAPVAAVRKMADPAAQKRLELRILIAEDGPDNQRLLSFLLKRAGADVTVAENGQIAADKAMGAGDEGRPFDVILMDMQMPVMDGYTATSFLRHGGYRGTIIALTAHAMSGDREKCLATGCDEYAPKPIEAAKLIALIGETHRRVVARPCAACSCGAEVQASMSSV